MLKDSEIGNIAAIGPIGDPPASKYERLIARAKEVPPATTIVIHPCEETALRGPIEAAEAGIIVTAYADRAEGVMEVGRDGSGRFKGVVLHPTVTVAAGSDVERARALHKPAHEKCFVANSVNFPVECEPEIVAAR